MSGYQEWGVWHQDPIFEAIVNKLITDLKPKRFVETGTYLAETTRYIARKYPWLQVHSVEIRLDFFERSAISCKFLTNVKLYCMSSPDFLKMIYDTLKDGLTVFWLDAHWWEYVPLRDECKIIATLDKYVAILDDFASNNPRFGGDVFAGGHENNLSYVADILGKKCCVPNYPSFPPYNKGYGIFIKGVDYPCPEKMREETIP